jgi:hypothetical protein
MQTLVVRDETFRDEPGKTWPDMLRAVQADTP